ncbi:hypothetical protein ABPG75_007312 [Micractinium tetrahymenae]
MGGCLSASTPRTCSVGDLPDDVIARILSLCGRRSGMALTLVCRRWRRAFFCEPALWRQVAIVPAEGLGPQQQAERSATQAAVLARVGAAVHELCLVVTPALAAALAHSSGGSGSSRQGGSGGSDGSHKGGGDSGGSCWACLQALCPEALAELRLTTCLPSPSDVQQLADSLDLARFSRLQLLEMHIRLAPMPASLAAALGQLPRLQRLTVHSFSHALPPGALPAACPALRRLARLELRCQSLPPTEAFTALDRLQRLHLADSDPAAAAAAVGASTRGDAGQQPLPDCLPNLAAFPPSLRHLTISRQLAVAGASFHTFSYRARPPWVTLSFGGLRCADGAGGGAQLTHLLAALLPPRAALYCLELSEPDLVAAGPAGGCQLGALRVLRVLGLRRRTPLAALDAWLRSLLSQALALDTLVLSRCLNSDGVPQGLPPALVERAGIARLALLHNSLASLQPGPWLAALRELCIAGNDLESLPAALAGAPCLERLLAGRRGRLDEPPLTLTWREADQVLLRMPSLRQLELYGTVVPPRIRQHLRAAAPQLQVCLHGAQWGLPDGWSGGLSEPAPPDGGLVPAVP